MACEKIFSQIERGFCYEVNVIGNVKYNENIIPFNKITPFLSFTTFFNDKFSSINYNYIGVAL